MGAVFIQNRYGSCRTHVNEDQRGLMLPQSGNIRSHQVGTGLSGVFQKNIQTGFQTGPYHQRHFSRELLDRSAHGVEYLRHNGSNDRAFDLFAVNTVDLHKDLQIHAVLVGGLGCLCAQSCLEDNILVLNTTQHNVGVANING